jgi:hypothetical protein
MIPYQSWYRVLALLLRPGEMVSTCKDCVLHMFYCRTDSSPVCRKPDAGEAAGLPWLVWCTVVHAVWLCGACCGEPWSMAGCTMVPVIFPEFLLFFLQAPIGQARHGSTEMTVICA